ncbi:hypothetical protein ZIOFF_049112 [Zingiber officinale]|uniref:E3 ubiquitin-protein ligase CHFR cysteine rich domain-containing protein n=1 Tax=Zingiber officinale TaxID=94328 RepID=A0A8J5FS73_ZINOF|nr:hypothetical protein ZIOFF_049112 [Zingiber officinale]
MERAETSRSKDDSRVRAKLGIPFPCLNIGMTSSLSVYFLQQDPRAGFLRFAVPTDSAFPSIKIESCEALICSATVNSSDDKHQWCEITWKNDSDIVTLRNLSSNPIIVDGELIEETVVIKSGSEITSGPDKEGQDNLSSFSHLVNLRYLTYIFEPLPSRGNDKKRIEAILQKFSSLKRSGEEINLLNKYASIKSNIVLGMPKYPSRKRPHTFSDNGGIEVELPCFQCVVILTWQLSSMSRRLGTGSELGGFRCNGTTTHLSCHGCGAKMPSRPDIGVPQNCLGCSRTFCGAYWTTQGLDAQQFNVICPEETFKPVWLCQFGYANCGGIVFERTILRIPDSVHRNNRYEKDVTERCIERTGKTLQVLISDLITKFGNKEIGKLSIMIK